MTGAGPPEPIPPDLLRLVQNLIELRDTLEATALALSDLLLSLDSSERRTAELETKQAIERAKAP